MLFDGRDPDFQLHALVDFAFLELAQLRVEAIDFRFELVESAVEPRFERAEVVFGRHVLDDVAEHFAEFFGRSLLGGHMRAVYQTGRWPVRGHGFWKFRRRILDG